MHMCDCRKSGASDLFTLVCCYMFWSLMLRSFSLNQYTFSMRGLLRTTSGCEIFSLLLRTVHGLRLLSSLSSGSCPVNIFPISILNLFVIAMVKLQFGFLVYWEFHGKHTSQSNWQLRQKTTIYSKLYWMIRVIASSN